jgi:hypothetical protein
MVKVPAVMGFFALRRVKNPARKGASDEIVGVAGAEGEA